MTKFNSNVSSLGWLTITTRGAALLALLLALAACGKDEPASKAPAGTAPATTEATKPAAKPATPAKPAQAVSDKVAAMGADDLRKAAATALREQRLYAPGGNNAMEYYLALRDKQPNDPAVASALTDLMPYTLIATEQSIVRQDFDEALRLYALMEKADAKAPALPRLKQSIADAQAEAAQQKIAAQERSEEAKAREEELAKQRELEQQKAQEEAAAQLAAQQAAQQAEAQRQAAQRAAAQKAAAQAASETAEETATEEPESSAAGNTKLVVVSTVPPTYPRKALRRRQEGEVTVEFVVGTNGSVTSARVVSATPRNTFDNAALQAVKQWKFKPMSESKTVRQTLTFNPGG